MFPLAQLVPPPSFWNAPSGSSELFLKIGLALLLGIVGVFVLLKMPTSARRPVVALVTFLSGLFYVLLYIWPQAIDRQKVEAPRNVVEGVAFWLDDAVSVVANFTNILSGFLLGLGIYSLLRVHGRRILKTQRDWQFSAVLLLSMLLMVFFGYADWFSRQGEAGAALELRSNWTFVNYGRDFFFEGLLQQMDAAMFSIIAFYILSAAYRAFRIRSIEATILLGTALIVMFSLMGTVESAWGGLVNPSGNADNFSANFTLTEIAKWIRNAFQTPAIRGIDFGVGIGALAMGLRLWLSLEKGGSS